MRRTAVLLLTALALALCSGCAHRGTTVHEPGLLAVPPRNAGLVRITQVMAGTAIPTEGALSYIRVESPDGTAFVARQLPRASGKLRVRLKPGDYRLFSWQRTCDANCGNLDPPSDRCSRAFTVTPHQQLDVTIRVDYAAGCTIELGG